MGNIISFLVENPIYISIAVFVILSVLVIHSDIGKDKLEENNKKGKQPKGNSLLWALKNN